VLSAETDSTFNFNVINIPNFLLIYSIYIDSEQAKQLVIAQLMNREEIKRKGLASSSTLGYARRRRKSSSRIFLGTWAWKSN
jgi:hypothetical protein